MNCSFRSWQTVKATVKVVETASGLFIEGQPGELLDRLSAADLPVCSLSSCSLIPWMRLQQISAKATDEAEKDRVDAVSERER